MEAHLGVLLDLARQFEQGIIDDDAVYVWWGKVRSPNRQQPLAHGADLDAMAAALERDDAPELHLYLTDYRSLYVGHVVKISRADQAAADPAHVPPYYAANRLACDRWFQLADIRRLVQDDTLAVIEELRRLRNVHYHDRPVSLYGGMVDLPLVVHDPDGRHYFDSAAYARYTEDRLWAVLDAEAGGLGAMQRELRENLLGDAVWLALDPATRGFLATAEKVFRDHRNEEGFDFQAVLTGFAKALEVEVNRVLRMALAKAPAEARRANLDGQTVDAGTHGSFSLGELARIIGGERAMNEWLRQKLVQGDWFAASLPAILAEFAPLRNRGTHRKRVTRDEALRWRDQILGVGCEGVVTGLGRVRGKAA